MLAVSDRVLVINEGEIMGEFVPGEIDYTEIGLMMGGTKRDKQQRQVKRYDLYEFWMERKCAWSARNGRRAPLSKCWELASHCFWSSL